jgi:hypothetical protein
MMPYVVRPLDPWIGPVVSRRDSPFKSNWTDTLRLLSREVQMLGAKSFVLQINVSERWIRQDGELYSRAVPTTPAIRVCFDSRHGPQTYPCDAFNDWQANVRAVALSLEALRRVDRYGVAGHGEQYRGWVAIDSRPAKMTVEQAAEFIAEWSGLVVTDRTAQAIMRDPQTCAAAYRAAARRAHPDVTGDDGDTMARLNAARDLILNGSSHG